MKRFVKRSLVAVVLVASTAVSAVSFATPPETAPAAAPKAAPAAPTGGNYLLLNEMVLLNKAYRDIISAVVLEDSKGVVDAVEGFETSQVVQMTRDAFKAGKIKTPKNPERMKEFEGMDRDFHNNFDKLRDYAKADNRPKIRYIAKKLLDNCIKCHEQFRK
ncbi:MAG: cytochrome c [Deltaproteobacteria bacterium]|nr:cytochrome c [Deltaproteobacteria bacterium]